MATRTIYLVRHGYYDLQSTHRLEGSLTPIGVEQAQLTARRLSSLPINTIHCSTLRRAAETAEIIAQKFPGVPLHKSKGLKECVPCVPPNYAEYYAGYPAQNLAWGKNQAEKAFDKYFKRTRGQDKHEIIVAHGNLIRYFICRVLQVEPEAWGNMDLCNCGLCTVLINPDGRMILVSHNDVSHLPDHLVTSLVGPRLAETLYTLAQIAFDQDDLVEARRRGHESLSILTRAKLDNAAEVKAWLDELPAREEE